MTTYMLALLVAPITLGAEVTALPKEALAELEYRVGRWESVAFTDGKKEDRLGKEVTKWARGKYCSLASGSFVENGVNMTANGIFGWDADKKQLVEHWYASDGGYATFRYSLDKKKDSWVGTFTWVYGDGRKVEGESIVEKKGQDEWEWNASFKENGKVHTWRTINKRVKEG